MSLGHNKWAPDPRSLTGRRGASNHLSGACKGASGSAEGRADDCTDGTAGRSAPLGASPDTAPDTGFEYPDERTGWQTP